ncbi:protein kinase [Arthrobacter gandavensis]|uniref:serine/threonine-protein kinase n=1 Tax=Arthrobacter gandavensis TaxID=169960 RepID=UPI00188F37E7|nr:serine/threonine-protein kinase [Arthrobacter gandavensis]MBF4992950.1 protein kinase [Arthrobacter gandavensis]
MKKRPPAPPPAIHGFRFLEHLGSGGFADVYLYEQDRPRRRVAVKVLLSDLRGDSARAGFEAEANLMAQLSSHPYIVTIYEADTTAEGRSYLAMEYCSRPSLDARYRQGGLPLAEVLAVGVQVASAVETAHRAGIAHRDIKPANILTTDYNRPALTDFGISGTMDGDEDGDVGMSIPWSPPEALSGARVDGIRADVYSLGATLYTLLAGRSPYLRPGRSNAPRDLVDRIISEQLTPTGRSDVPESLELALATAMAKSPESRYSSAYAFALALQRIQAELNLSVTEFAVLDEAGRQEPAQDDGERTRVRRVVSIDPAATTFPPTLRGRTSLAPATNEDTADGTVLRAPAVLPAGTQPGNAGVDAGGTQTAAPPGAAVPGGTQPRSGTDSTPSRAAAGRPVPQDPDAGQTAARKRALRGRLIAGLAGAALVAAVAAAAVLAPDPEPRPEAAQPSQPPSNALGGLEGSVAPPSDLTGVREADSAVFRWDNPDPQEGDIYLWRTVTATSKGELVRTSEAGAEIPATTAQTCIEVQVARANGRASEPAAVCTG